MDRSFGWEPPVDETSESAKSILSAEIVEVLESNIPGLTVESIDFEENILNGHIYPKVKVVIEDVAEI